MNRIFAGAILILAVAISADLAAQATGTVSSGSGGGTTAGAGTGATGEGKVTPMYDAPAGTHYEPKWNYDPHVMENVPVPYPYLREADIKFRRRVWRVVDLRQKMNRDLTWPGNPLTKIVYDMALEGKIRPYMSDSLKSWYTPEDVKKVGAYEVVTQIQDWMFPDDEFATKDTAFWVNPDFEKIQKFQIMEDWIFDYKHSVFKPRIIAIAPMLKFKSTSGQDLGEFPMFWLKMDDLRPTFVKTEVFNRYNDAMRITVDDFFNNLRVFDSYVVRHSNQFNRYIADQPEFKDDGIMALLESDRIKNELFVFEQDLWEY